jgi:SAM-dependent methyltransferase
VGSEELGDPVARARALATTEEAAELYRTWAGTYDDDVFGRLGFTGSARIAELLIQHLPSPAAAVLDLGCGTGAVGRRLAELGATTVDGVDLSPEMLELARQTGGYRRLAVLDLTAADLDVGGPYAATVSAGTFTSGHVGASVVPRLLAAIEPGGVVAWVIGAGVWPAFDTALAPFDLAVLHRAVEPIRRDGPPEAVMYVARTPSSPFRSAICTSSARSADQNEG